MCIPLSGPEFDKFSQVYFPRSAIFEASFPADPPPRFPSAPLGSFDSLWTWRTLHTQHTGLFGERHHGAAQAPAGVPALSQGAPVLD